MKNLRACFHREKAGWLSSLAQSEILSTRAFFCMDLGNRFIFLYGKDLFVEKSYFKRMKYTSFLFAFCFWACSDNASDAPLDEPSSSSFAFQGESSSHFEIFSSAEASLSSAGELFSSGGGESSSLVASSNSEFNPGSSAVVSSSETGISSNDVSSISSSSATLVSWDEIVLQADLTSAQLQRAEEFRRVVVDSAGRTRNAVYVYRQTVGDFSSAPEKLAARIAVLGFNDVYLSPGKSLYTNPNDWIRTFIRTLSGYGIDVHAQRLPVTGSSGLELLTSESAIDAEIALVSGYNSQVAPDERFAGLSADIEVHTIKSGFSYTWDKGANSDTLLRMAQSALEYAGKKLRSVDPNLKLSEAIAMPYDKYYNEGKFTNGSSGHFLKFCDWVILMDYYTKDTQLQRYAQASFGNATKNASVSVALKVKGSGLDAFQDWETLLSSLQTLFETSIGYKNPAGFSPFRGLDFFTYEGLENLWFEG